MKRSSLDRGTYLPTYLLWSSLYTYRVRDGTRAIGALLRNDWLLSPRYPGHNHGRYCAPDASRPGGRNPLNTYLTNFSSVYRLRSAVGGDVHVSASLSRPFFHPVSSNHLHQHSCDNAVFSASVRRARAGHWNNRRVTLMNIASLEQTMPICSSDVLDSPNVGVVRK
ncbi:hypothetical protein LZ32DRAFT_82749 [Colletotrichum eremochloae]|nr:hypothetical protein LZ32DRAFT_82749 [Colletotrichum eremochloae]